MQAVQQEYTTKGAKIGPDLPIEFESDSISLKLPSNEGILDSGWRLIPLFHPMVRESARQSLHSLFKSHLSLLKLKPIDH